MALEMSGSQRLIPVMGDEGQGTAESEDRIVDLSTFQSTTMNPQVPLD